jgi:hypothetical protein
MHSCRRTLALGLSAIVFVGCASPPTRPSTSVQNPTLSSAHYPSTHHAYFEDLIAVVAAMGGSNPNHAYQAFRAKGCEHGLPDAGAAQPIDNPAAAGLQQTTVSAPCQRVATK